MNINEILYGDDVEQPVMGLLSMLTEKQRKEWKELQDRQIAEGWDDE